MPAAGDAGIEGTAITSELERILNARSDGASDPDDVPGVPDDPLTRVGDLWSLGWHHYLLCGDATIRHDVERLLGEARPHLMIVDPPYGVEYDPEWRNRADRKSGRPIGARATRRPVNDHRSDWSAAWALFTFHDRRSPPCVYPSLFRSRINAARYDADAARESAAVTPARHAAFVKLLRRARPRGRQKIVSAVVRLWVAGSQSQNGDKTPYDPGGGGDKKLQP
jgi:hypothetical protein